MTKYKVARLRLGRNFEVLCCDGCVRTYITMCIREPTQPLFRAEENYGKTLIDLAHIGIFRKHSDF